MSQQKFRQGTRRKLTKFRLDEISAVDHPAQINARAVLTKRRTIPADNNDDGSTKGACGESYSSPIVVVTSEEDGHTHAIRIYGGERGGETSEARSPGPLEEMNHAHPWSMDADGTITIGANRGHTHGVDQRTLVQAILSVTKRCADEGTPVPFDSALLAFVEKASASEDPSMTQPTTTTKAVPTAEDFAKLQGDLARLTKVAELSDAHRAHYHKIGDDAGKAAFLTKSATERDVEITAAAAAALAKAHDGDVVHVCNDGTQIRKSDGPTVLALAKRADAAEKRAAESAALAADAQFEKRADEIDKLPGDLAVRKAVVKALSGIPDDAHRTAAFEMLKAGNAAMAGAFAKGGVRAPLPAGGSTKEAAQNQLDTLAKKRASEKSVDYYEAYDQVSNENPALLEVAVGRTAPTGVTA